MFQKGLHNLSTNEGLVMRFQGKSKQYHDICSQVFNNVREVFNRKSIDFIGGVSLVKERRNGKNVDLKELEESVENATDARNRQVAIENYLTRKARDVMVTRTIQWNVSETARALLNKIPEAIKTKITSYITEGTYEVKFYIHNLIKSDATHIKMSRGNKFKFFRIFQNILLSCKLNDYCNFSCFFENISILRSLSYQKYCYLTRA